VTPISADASVAPSTTVDAGVLTTGKAYQRDAPDGDEW
jgi:hypothetical protein